MRIFLLALVAILISSVSMAGADGNLESGFFNPPAQARPHTWWHWMNGNITRKGITADLEAMARVGIGGAQIFNVAGSHGCDIPAGQIDYLSAEWLDMVKHAASEAKRLGLELCFHNCAGWATTGGPWIKPEYAVQALVSTEVKVEGGKRITQNLPLPEIRENYYRDIAILAFPTPKNDRFRVHKWHPKAAQQGNRPNRLPDLTTPGPPEAVIDPDTIVDVKRHLRKDGTILWDAPQGHWTILRMGHTPTGAVNHPAPESGRGLEIDKFRRVGVDIHWRQGIQPVLDHLGPLAGKVLNNILIDSYEAGHNQWSPCLLEEFKKRCGYDPTPYLLTLRGRLVKDVATTERFLWDFRRTVADLYADNYYLYFAKLCHDKGLLCSIEPYRTALEGLAVAAGADIPMGEFWASGGFYWTLKLVASAAHTNGRTLAAAESFTSAPPLGRWQNYPGMLRRTGDLVWTKGINRFIFHRFTHQPWIDQVPGMTMGRYGTHFDRTNTWWEPGRAWMQYIARSQFLLQSGEFAADVLVFAGEATPNLGVTREDIKATGYDYDACGTDIMAALKVEDGDVVLPCGKRYRLLVMPNIPFQTPALARKVRKLVRAGAAVLGPKPKYNPSLTGFPASEKEVVAIGELVWGKCDGKAVTSNRFGKGQVFTAISPVEALARLNISPAVQLPSGLAWIHRRTADAEIYFVSNQSNKTVQTVAGFLAAGKKPEFFDAERGTVSPAPGWTVSGKHVRVPLDLAPEKSVFVVFRHPGKAEPDPYVRVEGPAQKAPSFDASKGTRLRAWDNGLHTLHRASGKTSKIKLTGLPEPLKLSGPWNVRFQPKRGAPEKARFDNLMSWTEHTDPGIRHFSGTATTSTRFDLPKGFLRKGQEVWLDLGEVAVMAEVRLNQQNLGILWHHPFRIEVSKALRPGSNTLEIDVTNLWVNRIIGDERYPADCEWTGAFLTRWPDWLTSGQSRPVPSRITFTTWKHWSANDPLLPSGLLGPVTLRCARLAGPKEIAADAGLAHIAICSTGDPGNIKGTAAGERLRSGELKWKALSQGRK